MLKALAFGAAVSTLTAVIIAWHAGHIASAAIANNFELGR